MIMWSLIKQLSAEQVAELIDRYAADLGDDQFCREAARQIVLAVQPDRAVPASMERFQSVIAAGLEYFLSRLSPRRLKAAALEVVLQQSDSEAGRSIFHLALHFPSLHKLCQVVARRPDIDPDLKKWLVKLEKGSYGTPLAPLIELIEKELSSVPGADGVTIIAEMVAEASVAAVIPFAWQSPDHQAAGQGVFKVLRPQVEEKLEEELRALAEMAAFLEENRAQFGLQHLRLAELIEELKNDLRMEINLVAEQRRLAQAAEVYETDTRVHIPAVLPFCTSRLSAMVYFNGVSVGDLELSAQQSFALAELLCTAIISAPLFWKDDRALFHGDPHAGNILALPGSDGQGYEIVLLDWTLAGTLSRAQRILIMRLLLGILKADTEDIAQAIIGLAADRSSGIAADIKLLRADIENHLQLTSRSTDDPLVQVFRLLEHTALQGISFPSELVLYRKAFFTLEGVLSDIDPGFVMADSLERHLRELLLRELPLRSAAWFLPGQDDAASYRSLVSTADLQSLLVYRTFSDWQRISEIYTDMIGVSFNLAADWFSLMAGEKKK